MKKKFLIISVTIFVFIIITGCGQNLNDNPFTKLFLSDRKVSSESATSKNDQLNSNEEDIDLG
ncbi:MAG: hypothetical protein HQK51_05715, partial [Oligoflexia bacterium]|nr:hypothetical protein [Oligoflexia bacterium]